MKQPTAILFAFLFLIGGLMPRSNFKELEKIPSMFSHFQEHKRKTAGDFTFVEFLVLHFSIGSEHEEPVHATDLPLHGGVTASFAFMLPSQFSIANSVEEFAVKHYRPFSINYHFQYASAWFQPPQG